LAAFILSKTVREFSQPSVAFQFRGFFWNCDVRESVFVKGFARFSKALTGISMRLPKSCVKAKKKM
jgi:hypothetical protein